MTAMFETVFLFGIIIFTSFGAVKFKLISPDFKEGLSQLILNLTMPLLIFTSTSSISRENSSLTEILAVCLWAAVIITFILLLSMGICKLLNLPPKTSGVQLLLMTFGNVVFMAFPLIEALYGEQGLFYAVFFQFVSNVMLWVIGYSLLDQSKKPTIGQRLKRLVNPNLVALTLGITFFMLGLKLPSVLHEPLASLGKITNVLSLVFIGVTMSGIKLSNVFKNKLIYYIIFFKMLLLPALTALTLTYLVPQQIMGIFALSNVALNVVVLQSAMPSMVIISILAHGANANYEYAAEAIFATTIASLATLPFVFWLTQLLLR